MLKITIERKDAQNTHREFRNDNEGRVWFDENSYWDNDDVTRVVIIHEPTPTIITVKGFNSDGTEVSTIDFDDEPQAMRYVKVAQANYSYLTWTRH